MQRNPQTNDIGATAAIEAFFLGVDVAKPGAAHQGENDIARLRGHTFAAFTGKGVDGVVSRCRVWARLMRSGSCMFFPKVTFCFVLRCVSCVTGGSGSPLCLS